MWGLHGAPDPCLVTVSHLFAPVCSGQQANDGGLRCQPTYLGCLCDIDGLNYVHVCVCMCACVCVCVFLCVWSSSNPSG